MVEVVSPVGSTPDGLPSPPVLVMIHSETDGLQTVVPRVHPFPSSELDPMTMHLWYVL